MNIRMTLRVLAAAVVATAPTIGQAGVRGHPVGMEHASGDLEPARSTLTRAEVLRELEAARKDGSLRATQRRRPATFEPRPAADPDETRRNHCL